MLEIQSLIPTKSRLLGMVHNENFRPTIAPNSSPVNKGRVLFEQNGATVDFATAVRSPICLLSEGDTELFRKIGNPEEGIAILKRITENSPTAAVLFDASRKIKSNPTVHWFAEDQFFANTVARAIGAKPEDLLPFFRNQSDETRELLERMWSWSKGKNKVKKHDFSNHEVMDAINEAIHLEALRLNLKSSERKKLKESSAAVVGITHALFPLIISLMSNKQELAAVQGPVHLETNPPNWLDNPALSTVKSFVNQAAQGWQLNHRSLAPCMFDGEPIGEFSAFDMDGSSPQLRRDHQHKLTLWANQSPFPLSTNPIFGHAIGLIEDPAVSLNIEAIVEAEKLKDFDTGEKVNKLMAKQIDDFLTIIKFWRKQ